MTQEPKILYQDELLLAVDKPSGLAVHRGWSRDPWTLVDWLRRETGAATVYPVGRLDRATSGLVLFAHDAQGARLLQEALAAAGGAKRYIALVRGRPPASGTVDHPLPRRDGGPRVPSCTRFATLATVPTEPRHLSLVEAFPATGRLHQVRRHLKHINHPLIGDANYGRTELNRAIRERYGLGRLALHAAQLRLHHPLTRAELVLESLLPEDLVQPFRRMGLPEELLE